MRDERLVEEIARAFCALSGSNPDEPFEGSPMWDIYREEAYLTMDFIAREVAAQKERDAAIAEKATAYDDNLQRSAGCGTTGQRIAAAIRSAG